MYNVKIFLFSPVQENTYVLFNEHKEAIIIDPGCYGSEEQEELRHFIEKEGLSPTLLLNTHCHLDHVFGNKWVTETFHIPFYAHREDIFLLHGMAATAGLYGFAVEL